MSLRTPYEAVSSLKELFIRLLQSDSLNYSKDFIAGNFSEIFTQYRFSIGFLLHWFIAVFLFFLMISVILLNFLML